MFAVTALCERLSSRMLRQAGAKPSQKDNDGDSPGHYASAQGKIAVLKLLAEWKADLEAVDNDGESVLDVADGARTRTALRSLIDAARRSAEDEEGEEDEESGEDEKAERS